MLLTIYFLINVLESFALASYLVLVGSSAANAVFLNTSPLRLATSACVLAIGLLFLVAMIRSLKKEGTFSNKLRTFLQNERALQVVMGLSLLAIALILFALTRRPTDFGDLQLVVERFEPIMVWLTVIFAQTGILIFAWYCLFFVNDVPPAGFEAALKELGWVLVLFLLYTAAKLAVINTYAYGLTIPGDEITYFDIAESLYRGFFSISDGYHYPPLYPLAIVAPLVFNDWAFEGIKLINTLLISSTLFPLYLLSRQFLGKKKSLLFAFISGLHALNLLIPGHLLSENLFIPLFAWVMFIIFSRPKNRKFHLWWDLINGAAIGLLYLTRYITLALIPTFLLAWWIKPGLGEQGFFKPGKKKITHFFLLVIVMLLVFSPWITLTVRDNLPLKMALGFGIASQTSPEQLTFLNLLIYLCLYLCYYLLVAAPVLHLASAVLRTIDLKRYREGFSRLVLQVLLVASGFLVAIVRHSWRAYYNAIVPSKIMGRYLIMFSAFFILLGAISLELFDKKKYKHRLGFLLTDVLIPYAFIIFSYLVIVQGSIISTDNNLLNPQGSVDGYLIRLLGPYFWVLLVLVYATTSGFLRAGKVTLAQVAFYLGLSVYFAAVLPTYSITLRELQTYPFLAAQAVKQIRSQDIVLDEDESFIFYLPADADGREKTEFLHGLTIRGVENFNIDIYSPHAARQEITNGLVILKADVGDLSQEGDAQYYQFNGEYYIFQYTAR